MSFQENFTIKLNQALTEVKKVLGTNRNPVQPANCTTHTYDDKFLLAEIGTRVAIASITASLDAATNQEFSKALPQILQWAASGQTVTLEANGLETCTFVKTTTRQEESATKYVTQTNYGSKKEHFSVTTITEHFWTHHVEYEIACYAGTKGGSEGEQSRAVLVKHQGEQELKTTGKTAVTPKPERYVSLSRNLNIDWLLAVLAPMHNQAEETTDTDGSTAENKSLAVSEETIKSIAFHIDRTASSCHTPRRNVEVEKAISFFQTMQPFIRQVQAYIVTHMKSFEKDAYNTYGANVYNPLAAAFHFEEASGEEAKGPTTFRPQDISMFLYELSRSLEAGSGQLAEIMTGGLLEPNAGRLALGLTMARIFCQQHVQAMDMIEQMLYTQLSAAVGKVVTPDDYDEYMDFHFRQIFREEYRPRGFCQAVRRPNHYPEGTLSILKGKMPVKTMVAGRSSNGGGAPAMRFALNASADVTFCGEQYLHTFILHKFSHQRDPVLNLSAQARQFSSFILMIGKLPGANEFEPEHAIIVKDKDDVMIPMLLKTIPTAKEFKQAVESLSPEQQRFAKAFRSMQLASTLFAMVVIQIKPQLERVLNLPAYALTKEIKLTQELMELFIEYQIPPDLLSYDADRAASQADEKGNLPTPVAVVKENVEAIRAFIQEEKDKELAQAREEQKKRMREREEAEREVQQMQRRRASMKSMARAAPMAMEAMPPPPMAAMSPPPPMAAMSRSMPMAVAAPMPMMAMAMEDAMPMELMEARETKLSENSSQSNNAPADQKPDEPVVQDVGGGGSGGGAIEKQAADWTAIPREMDATFEKLDTDAALRPTIISVSDNWQRKRQKGLLSKPVSGSLRGDGLSDEKRKAFDLLDALTRSGVLPIETETELHVVLCTTHCFDKTLVDTIIQDNVNPIEKSERSALIVAGLVQGMPAQALLLPNQLERVQTYSPGLFQPEAIEN